MPSLKEWNQIIHHIGDLTHEVHANSNHSLEEIATWCVAHVGERYLTWANDAQVWYFKSEAVALEFALTWS